MARRRCADAGKACLALFGYEGGKLVLRNDASTTDGVTGEVKDPRDRGPARRRHRRERRQNRAATATSPRGERLIAASSCPIGRSYRGNGERMGRRTRGLLRWRRQGRRDRAHDRPRQDQDLDGRSGAGAGTPPRTLPAVTRPAMAAVHALDRRRFLVSSTALVGASARRGDASDWSSPAPTPTPMRAPDAPTKLRLATTRQRADCGRRQPPPDAGRRFREVIVVPRRADDESRTSTTRHARATSISRSRTTATATPSSSSWTQGRASGRAWCSATRWRPSAPLRIRRRSGDSKMPSRRSSGSWRRTARSS